MLNCNKRRTGLLNQNTLIFGGAFDPIHNGHLTMLREVLASLKIDNVVLIPNFMCPNKMKPLFSGKKRLEMIRKIIKEDLQPMYENITFECSDYEINQQKICFTIDTLRMYKTKKQKDTFFLLMGSDNFFSFHLWKQYQDILKLVTVCVVRRDKTSTVHYQNYSNKYLSKLENKPVFIFGKMPIKISSSDIRQKIKHKLPIKTLVPKTIITYLNRLLA
ncbi:MAG: nicotinate (nicotinamide) nucleotide adenylyltransferase [Rickettsiales bacterium]|nr:nicotinate (nicotinamide) nucleotide adenylyltransferase [Rickettsiales bacterium]